MRASRSVLIGACLTAPFAAAAAASGEWEILISSLDATVPGVPDAVWVPNSFNNPTISNTGAVSFRGQIGGPDITLANSRLILRGAPGNWEIVVRDGSPVPGDLVPGYVFNQMSGLNGLASSNNMSANGGVIATGNINGPGVAASTDTAAFFVFPDGSAGLLVREGDPYPGGGGSVMSSSMSLSSGVRISDAGSCLISTSLAGGDVSGSANNAAIVRLQPSEPTAIFRKGDPAPGFSDGTTLNPDAFGLNVNGEFLLFPGTLAGDSVTTANDKALFTSLGAKSGSLRMVCREGDPVPGMPGVNYRSTASFTPAPQPINFGGIYFIAELEGDGIIAGVNDRAVFFQQADGSQQILLRRGDAVPGVSSKQAVYFIMNSSSWATSPNGILAFQGLLQAPDGSSVDNASFVGFRTPDGLVQTICRMGDPVPGTDGGTFGQLNGSTSLAVSEAGIVVFQNNVQTAAGSIQHLFAWDELGGLRVIAKAGDTLFTGTPANQITLIGSTGQNGDGGGTGLNPSGVLVIRAGDTVNQIYSIARIDLASNGPQCPGDFNDDGMVDGADLAVLLSAWGVCPPKGSCEADLNADGEVNGADLAILLGNWGACG